MQHQEEVLWSSHLKNMAQVDWRKNEILWCLGLDCLLEKQRGSKEESR